MYSQRVKLRRPGSSGPGSGGVSILTIALGLFLGVWVMTGYFFYSQDLHQHDHHHHHSFDAIRPRTEDHHHNLRHNAAPEKREPVATVQVVPQLSPAERNLVNVYSSSKVTGVRRLKQSGTVKWGNGHDNRIWLMSLADLSDKVIFKTNHFDMLFTDPSGKYDPKAPYYINNEYALLSWVNEFVAFALDRVLQINMVPTTSLRRLTHDQFLQLFRGEVEPELDLAAAIKGDPISRTGMFRYTPPWYNGAVVEGAMVELLNGAVRTQDTLCSTFCKDPSVDSRGQNVCVDDHGRFFPVNQISDMMFADFILNSIDREVNCFLVPDASPGAADAQIPGSSASGPGKAYVLKMIDNESAEFAERGQTRSRQKESVTQYNRDRMPHGYESKRMMRYFVENAQRSGLYNREVCRYERSTREKFLKFHKPSPTFVGVTLGQAVVNYINDAKTSIEPKSEVLDSVMEQEGKALAHTIDERFGLLMEHVQHCPKYV